MAKLLPKVLLYLGLFLFGPLLAWWIPDGLKLAAGWFGKSDWAHACEDPLIRALSALLVLACGILVAQARWQRDHLRQHLLDQRNEVRTAIGEALQSSLSDTLAVQMSRYPVEDAYATQLVHSAVRDLVIHADKLSPARRRIVSVLAETRVAKWKEDISALLGAGLETDQTQRTAMYRRLVEEGISVHSIERIPMRPVAGGGWSQGWMDLLRGVGSQKSMRERRYTLLSSRNAATQGRTGVPVSTQSIRGGVDALLELFAFLNPLGFQLFYCDEGRLSPELLNFLKPDEYVVLVNASAAIIGRTPLDFQGQVITIRVREASEDGGLRDLLEAVVANSVPLTKQSLVKWKKTGLPPVPCS